jgi:pimeloyl-ACP methyl ester carboxylesterase
MAFLGGFPPDQPVYFYEYMKDVFATRSQTRALFDLILSLDEELPEASLHLPHYTVLVSGAPDFMTGVYHSKKLAKSMKNNKHVNFTMGSHFLLLEWPEIVAKEILLFIFKE